MASFYDKKIDKHVKWSGDKSTGFLPVKGNRVQEFLKEQLENRIGVLYYDTANNRYLAFADNTNRDEYLADPTQTQLLLGTFDAPFNYSAEINLLTPSYNAVFISDIGNYIDFTFDIKNKQGASTGENVYITYTFIHNATKQVVTETRRFGESVHFNVDKYIKEGTNTIVVGVSGQTTLAATTVAITYQVVNLVLKDEFNISKVYRPSNGDEQIEVIWSVEGQGTKVVEWYIDGTQLPFDRVVDEVVSISGGSPKYISLASLGDGVHSLQMRAYTTINSERFYTDTLYRNFFVYDGVDSNTMIGVALNIPKANGVVTNENSLVIYDIVQYVPYTFKFATFSPSGEANTNVDIYLGEDKKGSIASKNNVVNEFLFVSNKTGATALRLVTSSKELSIPANVAVTNMNLREITTGLAFDFNANGRSNNANDKDQWSFGSYSATFNGFNWNDTSGWVNNRLHISNGATFSVNYAPLSANPVALGRTIEIEFATTNVINDDTIICDLRENGVGILITATKVLLHSQEGVEIVNEFKENENVRFAFVINRNANVTNKGLAFIYTNGIAARCVNYSISDDFESNTNISFSGSQNAEVLLKAIRVYNQALSYDDILNNFILYRDNVKEMLDVYDRNNVYEEGSETFSPEKMSNRLPVMIVTGDIPTLENTNDKDTQIVVDIEYINMQDPSKSFTMQNAAMRPQGTSSMGYPKKNFRIYTQKVDNTIVIDAQGNIIEDKLYSFTGNAQPVDCWCLKADYAESSGTHNTGIARMWHYILMNTQIDDEYVLRTEAQKKAIAAGYKYDVRTTIDGFPILMFYRRNPTSDLIFIGKYNFNNDKSTESVFGFEGIPDFDNSRMQCWEILNNGNSIALFTDIQNFYNTITIGNETQEGWKFAFESRYPDTKNPVTDDLYNFAVWMNSVSQDAFATEKWQHMDVYKMAAYYCYLMRFAGADQFVKNAMLTSEDGEHFFFILYDNDTINGLINTGRLAINPSDNRQTKDATGEYVFAGHDSVLWNRLEADSEFMAIVSQVDDAMFSAGLSYDNAIHYFDELQAEKWVERVYNQDAQYKYINPYVESGTNNLFMLQGDRSIHRKWFLAKRFALYDSLFVAGAYKSQSMEFKCNNNTDRGQIFKVTSGNNMYYGYGINDVPREVGVFLNTDESYDFVTKETVYKGDPIRIYAAPNIKGLDFSLMTNRLDTMDVTKVYSESLGTKLVSLIIGNASGNNTSLTTISGLNVASKLEVLDVQGCKGLTSIDLSNQPYFKTLRAKGSSIASVNFANGAPVERIELPSLVQSLNLSQLPYLDGANVEIEGGWGNITSINVTECPNVTNDFSLVWNWFSAVTPNNCSLTMDNVAWYNMTTQQLIDLKSDLKVFNVSGFARLSSITLEEIDMLKGVFGENIFDKNQSFYISMPETIIIQGASVVGDGESSQYSYTLLGDTSSEAVIKFSISSGANSYVSINENTGLLTTTERGSEYNITVRVTYTYGEKSIYDEMSVRVKELVYPDNATINGSNDVGGETIYTWSTTTEGVDGSFYAVWSLSGDAYDNRCITIKSQNNEQAIVDFLEMPTDIYSATLTLTLKKTANNSVITTATKELTVKNPDIAISSVTNAPVMTVMYNKGLAANRNFMTKTECAAVTESQLQTGTNYSTSIFYSSRSSITSFDEFKYFTGITTVPVYLFYECKLLESITLPNTITSLGNYAFQYCEKLKQIDLPANVISLGNYVFADCKALTSISLPSGVTTIPRGGFSGSGLTSLPDLTNITRINDTAFSYCESITNVEITSSITFSTGVFQLSGVIQAVVNENVSIKDRTFSGCKNLQSVVIKSGCSIAMNVFSNCTALTNVTLESGVKSLDRGAFSNCTSLQEIILPDSAKILGNGNPFIGCGNLDIYVSNSHPSLYSEDGVLFNKTKTELIAYAKDAKQSKYTIPSTVTALRIYSFNQCSKLEEITFNDVITLVSGNCFQGCTMLKKVVSANILYVDDYAFASCAALEDIEINCRGDLGYGDYAFQYCSGLKTAIVHGVVAGSMFSGCASLQSIVIDCTKIDFYAFTNCKALKTITCLTTTAPTVSSSVFGSSTSNYVGRNTYNTGENVLYVPQGAAGYDTGQWLDPLQNAEKCGFTLSATL